MWTRLSWAWSPKLANGEGKEREMPNPVANKLKPNAAPEKIKPPSRAKTKTDPFDTLALLMELALGRVRGDEQAQKSALDQLFGLPPLVPPPFQPPTQTIVRGQSGGKVSTQLARTKASLGLTGPVMTSRPKGLIDSLEDFDPALAEVFQKLGAFLPRPDVTSPPRIVNTAGGEMALPSVGLGFGMGSLKQVDPLAGMAQLRRVMKLPSGAEVAPGPILSNLKLPGGGNAV